MMRTLRLFLGKKVHPTNSSISIPFSCMSDRVLLRRLCLIFCVYQRDSRPNEESPTVLGARRMHGPSLSHLAMHSLVSLTDERQGIVRRREQAISGRFSCGRVRARYAKKGPVCQCALSLHFPSFLLLSLSSPIHALSATAKLLVMVPYLYYKW